MSSISLIKEKSHKSKINKYNSTVREMIEDINVKFHEGIALINDDEDDLSEEFYGEIDELLEYAENNLSIQ